MGMIPVMIVREDESIDESQYTMNELYFFSGIECRRGVNPGVTTVRDAPAEARGVEMTAPRDMWVVYVIDLNPAVLSRSKFVAANPEYQPGKPCVYVGLTSLSAEERFQQHMSGVHSARIVRTYGTAVIHRECRRLRQMTRARAEKKEIARALALRKRGWAVWSN
jgi:hypothetical protein